jgi:hypothetical protein
VKAEERDRDDLHGSNGEEQAKITKYEMGIGNAPGMEHHGNTLRNH